MTKFKSQARHVIEIKYRKASGSGNPPSLIPALRKIAVLGLKTGVWQWYIGISVAREKTYNDFNPECKINSSFINQLYIELGHLLNQ